MPISLQTEVIGNGNFSVETGFTLSLGRFSQEEILYPLVILWMDVAGAVECMCVCVCVCLKKML